MFETEKWVEKWVAQYCPRLILFHCMCDFEKGFILCSCEPLKTVNPPKKKSKRNQNAPAQLPGYRWVLFRFTEYIEEVLMEGSFEPPVKDLGNGLNEEWVLLNLNLEKCFDFDYIPKEGDNLILRSNDRYKYLSFTFEKSIWISNYYDPFSTVLEKFKEGKIMNRDLSLQ